MSRTRSIGNGLYDRVNRIGQLVCNVSDLERSKDFWERWTPMQAVAKIEAPRQSFQSLGIDSGAFHGYLMKDRFDFGDNRGYGRFELWLIEWDTPKPMGRPYATSRNIGWYRLAFRTADPRAKYDELVAEGVTPFAAPDERSQPSLRPISGFGFPDPDGITIQVLHGVPQGPDRLSHLACPVLDVQRQSEFYRDVLGLVMISRETSRPIPNPWDAIGKPAPYETTFQRARGDSKLTLDVLQIGGDSPSTGTPYEAPTNLGYAQVGLEVDDITEAHRILEDLQQSMDRPDFRIAGPIEEWDLGPEVGPRKVVVLYDWMGIRYQLTENPGYPKASPSPVLLPADEDVLRVDGSGGSYDSAMGGSKARRYRA